MESEKIDNVSECPLVTVYMPTHNRVELLQRAVESVLNQDYKNVELIVVDDKSTDSTLEYLVGIAQKDSRVKYIRNKENSGACVSRNKAIFAAKGEFITGLDDDDYFLSNHILGFIRAWNCKDTDCIALYSNTYIKEQHTTNKVRTKSKFYKKRDLICGKWIGNQIFTKTDYLKEIGGFEEDLLVWQDFECWYRLLDFYNLKSSSIGQYSYVVDKSHPHERIGTKRADSIYSSYEIFCNKHKLNYNEKIILGLQLGFNNGKIRKFNGVIRKLVYLPRFYNFKHSLYTLFKLLSNS